MIERASGSVRPVIPMRAVEILLEEHRCMRRMLHCLDRILHEANQRGRLASDVAAPLLALFDHFADGCHQQKEESVLFPHLLAAIPTRDKGTVGKFYGEHEQERRLMASLRANLLGAIAGVCPHLEEFLRAGYAYLELHERHIAHEDAVLFPLALRLLEAHDDARLLEGFARVEAQAGLDAATARRRVDVLWARLDAGSGFASPG